MADAATTDVFTWRAAEAERSPRVQRELDEAFTLARGTAKTGPLTQWELGNLLRAVESFPIAKDYATKLRKIARLVFWDEEAAGVVHNTVRKRARGTREYRLELPALPTAPPAPTGAVASADAAFITGASWLGATAMRQRNRNHRDATARDYREAYETAMAALRSSTRTSEEKVGQYAMRAIEALRSGVGFDLGLQAEVSAAVNTYLWPGSDQHLDRIERGERYGAVASSDLVRQAEFILERRARQRGDDRAQPALDPRRAEFLTLVRRKDI